PRPAGPALLVCPGRRAAVCSVARVAARQREGPALGAWHDAAGACRAGSRLARADLAAPRGVRHVAARESPPPADRRGRVGGAVPALRAHPPRQPRPVASGLRRREADGPRLPERGTALGELSAL